MQYSSLGHHNTFQSRYTYLSMSNWTTLQVKVTKQCDQSARRAQPVGQMGVYGTIIITTNTTGD